MGNANPNQIELNVQEQTAEIIPFLFDRREVRTLIVDDQPWFVAADVAAALHYLTAKDLARNLDLDEKGRQILPTPGGVQEMLVINESGLFSAILRSRKTEAKRFKKWVTAEVLPAIRKHGRYEDAHNKMATLMDELIGMSEVNVIKGLIRDKAKVVPIDKRRSFLQSMHNRLHTRFNVPRVELIPAVEFEAACNFVAAYALDGEWIARTDAPPAPSKSCWGSIGVMVDCLEESYAVFEKRRLYAHLDGLGSPAGAELLGLLWDGLGAARHVKRLCAEQLARR